MKKKNIAKLKALSDQNLAHAILRCEEPELLERLQVAFPECFFEGDDRISLSHIRVAVGDETEGENECLEEFFLRRFKIPYLHLAHPDCLHAVQTECGEQVLAMTDELIERWPDMQIKGSVTWVAQDPLTHFEFQGKTYILLYPYEAEDSHENMKNWEIYAIPAEMVDETT